MSCGCSKPRVNDHKDLQESVKLTINGKIQTCTWCSGVLRRLPSGEVRCTGCGNKGS